MRIPQTPPKILPPPPGGQTQWSVMIPVYNCSGYLPELLNSILPQAMSAEDMQIEVVDDFSTDADIESMVRSIGNGRISYYRQPKNVGSLRNFETCINRSRGKYVHLLHGDDRLLPGFYKEMTNAFELFPEAGLALCAHDHIDSNGNLRRLTPDTDGSPYIYENWLEVEAEWQRTQYVAVAVKRSVYEKLGGFFGTKYGEDWEMWVRIAKDHQVVYVPKILAQYREHDSSISGRSYANGDNLRDITKVINTFNAYLPEEKRKRLKQAARKNYAYYALNRRYQFWKRNRHYPPTLTFFLAILKMHTDLKLIGKIFKVIFRTAILRLVDVVHYSSFKFFRTWRSILLRLTIWI